ncbi:hypothetical protein H7U32_05910 [Bifidobacterium pullorum subsp. saeculare]|uniref:Uncharacterized protein n=1 Tax=Bifidobacterium pullorum subsp. saeculare TaxID=78257 RepID=A0A938WYB8_9BIFI|nr:hypothetical protein [Bifidobacterium pullorum]MBM6699853.1 hypothetical protein [Bifidobacterium pullorum subsp. saeculare]
MRDWFVHAYAEVDFHKLFDAVTNDSVSVMGILGRYVNVGQLDHRAPEIAFDEISTVTD